MKPVSFLGAALAAVVIAGCGGGGGEETTSTPPATSSAPPALSKQQLISQGDAICAEVNAAVGTIGASSAGTASPAAQEASLYTAMVERLKALGAPQESAGYSELSSAAEALAQAEADVKLAAERGEEGALPAAEEKASSALTSFQSEAAAYGFKDCGEGPHAPSPTKGAPATGEEGGEEAAEGVEAEEAEPEPEPETEAPEAGGAETGGAGGGVTEEGGAGGGTEGGGGTSGGIGPG